MVPWLILVFLSLSKFSQAYLVYPSLSKLIHKFKIYNGNYISILIYSDLP